MSTATTLPFMGGEMGSFDPLDNGANESTASVGGLPSYDSAFSRCSIQVVQYSLGITSPTWTAASTFWFNACLFDPGELGTTTLTFLNGATVVAKLVNSFQTPTYTLSTLQSGVLTSVGTIHMPASIRNLLVIGLVSNTASGSVQVYLAGTLVLSVTGLNHSGFTGVTQVNPIGGATYWSEIICDTIPHVGGRLKTFPIDTVSATNTGFTGAVTDVNEVVYSDATFVYATANAQISTYYANGFSLGTYTIRAVAVGCRALRGATGPQNLENAIRVGGANYVGSSTALGIGYQAVTHSWTTNPNTSAAWTASGAQATEGGMEALT
jgi:hypothetical protein